MSMFDDLSSGWNNFTNTISGYFGGSPAKPAPAAPKVATASVQPSQPKTVTIAQPIAPPAQQPSFWDNFGGFMDGLQTTVGKVVTGISNYKSLQTAQELEKIRNKAILASAQNASLYAQANLPSTSDFINDPNGARNSVLPAIFSGGVSGGNLLLMAGAAALVYLAVKK